MTVCAMPTCTDEAATGTNGRPRKYCSPVCAKRSGALPKSTPCGREDCNTGTYAKGLCRRHYAATRPKTPYGEVEATCDCCGETMTRQRRGQRYKHTYCSWLCRDYTTWGARSSELPADHIVFHLDQTCEWVPPTQPHDIECGWCGDAVTTTKQAQPFCSMRCKKAQYKATRRGRQHNVPGTYSWTEIVKLWLSFGKACAYCCAPTPLTEIQAEHVHPISRGGANNLTNLLPSCGPCNGDKRDLLLHEWERDRASRGKPAVTTTWAHTDPRYMHLTTSCLAA